MSEQQTLSAQAIVLACDAVRMKWMHRQERCAVPAENLTDRKDERTTLQELATECGMSAFHLQRVFKRIVGVSPRAYQEAKRMDAFKEQLVDTNSVTDAVYAAGFGSSSRAYEKVGEKMGMTPGQYRRAGSGQMITFGVFDSELGKLLLAATERGVCSLRLGGDEPELIQELRQEFRAAKLVRKEEKVEPLAAIVRDAVRQGGTPELPLDVQATAFQARVWQALRAIPAGETRTYAGLATELGAPKAVRAVARACATNPVALAVPCHRVVRTGGSLAGYRWGVDRKRRLLEREAAAQGRQFKTSAGR